MLELLWEALRPVLLESLIGLVTAALGILSAWAVNSLRRKLDNEAARARMEAVARAAVIVVRDLEQNVVPAVKAGLADGKLTKAEGEKIKQLAVSLVLGHVGKAADGALVGNAIEAALYDMKQNRAALSPPSGES